VIEGAPFDGIVPQAEYRNPRFAVLDAQIQAETERRQEKPHRNPVSV
jgi:hypothetical protein